MCVSLWSAHCACVDAALQPQIATLADCGVATEVARRLKAPSVSIAPRFTMTVMYRVEPV
jgi:hypothetical protein